MAMSPNELFYRGYNPSPWYFGYDEPWIMTAVAAANSAEARKKEEEKKGIIEMKVPFCCDACVENVHKKLKAMDGVASVHCDQEKQKVVVKGDAKPEAVLKKVQKIVKRSEFLKAKS